VALVALCATQITSWGVLYYAFPVLAGAITAATGWSATTITAALSVSQLVAALVGVLVGRWIDRHGPRGVMTAGSVVAVPAVVLVATAESLAWFFLAWIVVGVAMSAVLYPPAFAALTRWYGPDPVRALTVLTLAGGLASTVFAPLTAVLAAHLDWRETYLVLAGILAVVTIPAHWFGLTQPWPPRPAAPSGVDTNPRRVAGSGAFLALVVAFSLTALTTYAAVIHLVPLLTERGVSTGVAAVALGLGGAGQVVGRLGYPAIVRHTNVLTRTAVVLLAIAVTTAVLGVLAAGVVLVVGAVVAGMARGMFTLLQATAVTDRWGRRHYGLLTALLSAPLTITMALAPFAGAVMANLVGSYATTFLVLGALAAAGAILSLLTRPAKADP
jgi:MFS family permease